MFFSLSKIFWAVAQPLNALCLLALAGLVLRHFRPRAGQMVMNAALISILVLGMLPAGPLALAWLERQYKDTAPLPEKVDGIIVLGGALEPNLSLKTGTLVINDQADRMLCFVDLALKYPKARLVFTGGSGDIFNPGVAETADATAFFDLSAIRGRTITMEGQSRNTYENAVYSKELVQPETGQTWVLVTSAFHMPRAVGIFEKIGWPVIPRQCDYKTEGNYSWGGRMPNVAGNFVMLGIAVREFIGLTVYYVTGKTAFILPPARIPSGS